MYVSRYFFFVFAHFGYTKQKQMVTNVATESLRCAKDKALVAVVVFTNLSTYLVCKCVGGMHMFS